MEAVACLFHDSLELLLRRRIVEFQPRQIRATKCGVEQMMDSVDILLRAVPQYDLPTVNENGDIIIRRRPPEPGRGLAPRRSSDMI